MSKPDWCVECGEIADHPNHWATNPEYRHHELVRAVALPEPVKCEPGCELCRRWGERGAHEIVICAAVLDADGNVVRCHRHHDGLRTLEAMGAQRSEMPCAQGFITSRNRYVDRYEAMRLQRAAGIESVAPGGYRGDELFSEDLY